MRKANSFQKPNVRKPTDRKGKQVEKALKGQRIGKANRQEANI
jgi:hypothetical protein